MSPTRSALLLVLVMIGSSQTYVHDHLRERAVRFDQHWDQYIRKLFGCELAGPMTRETCDLNRGVIDYAEFAKARAEAKRVFEFE